MDKDIKDIPLSESNKAIKLEDIQRRCKELLDDPDGLELSLEDGSDLGYDDPYNHC